MKKTFEILVICTTIIAAATVVMANPISDINRSDAYADLKESLERKYDGHYSTIEMLLNSGMSAYDEMCEIPDTAIDNKILRKLINKYYPSFSTIKMLYESNRKSYDRLNN